MTSGSAVRRRQEEAAAAAQEYAKDQARRRSHRVWRIVAGAVVGVSAVALVTVGLLTARPASTSETRVAPDFTLGATDGSSVTLSDLRGEPVILYFNEGAGCDSCTVQMDAIEEHPGFEEAGIRVLPIVMSPAERMTADMERLGVSTPFLLDDGTVSDAYGTLDTGMHPGLPGHGFVLIDADGTQLWQAAYPSMWLAPEDLLDEALSRL
jgi:peroxiredoxin